MKKNIDTKRVLNIVKNVAVWTILVLSVLMMVFTLISSFTINKNDRSLFGYKFFIVRTDSMSATHFSSGDIIICREVDKSTLVPGDIITFISQGKENFGETVTHMIRTVTEDENGDIAFVTYGTTTGVDDEALATMVVGKYQGRVPKAGLFFTFLKSTPGYILCILLPFLVLILSQASNFVKLYRQYKAEEKREVQADRDKLESERKENQKILEELLALKAQLAEKTAEMAAGGVEPAPNTNTVRDAAPSPKQTFEFADGSEALPKQTFEFADGSETLPKQTFEFTEESTAEETRDDDAIGEKFEFVFDDEDLVADEVQDTEFDRKFEKLYDEIFEDSDGSDNA